MNESSFKEKFYIKFREDFFILEINSEKSFHSADDRCRQDAFKYYLGTFIHSTKCQLPMHLYK